MSVFTVKNILTPETCEILSDFALNYREIEFHPCLLVPGSHICINRSLYQSISKYFEHKIEDLLGTKVKFITGYSRVYGKRDELVKQEDKIQYDYCLSMTFGFKYNGKEMDYKWPCYVIINDEKQYLTQDVGDALIYKNSDVSYGREPLLSGSDSYHIQTYIYYVDANGPNKDYSIM